MGKRRKTRTHSLRPDPTLTAKGGPNAIPKSFVVKSGRVGSSVSALVGDMRNLLEPNTASRLRERKRNRLRDFVAMAGPLGVSHLLVFSQADNTTSAALSNLNLRICRMPRGPTLTFKVLRYALSRDVLAASKHAHSPGKEFSTEPLLIFNNFGGQDKQLKLMTTVFQNLFPAIHVQSMPLTSARRVVLLSYSPETRTIDLRHYLISVRPIGVSKPVRKIIEGSSHSRTSSFSSITSNALKGVPDLSRAGDVAEYVLHHAELGYTSSASEIESEAESDLKHVELSGRYHGRSNKKISQNEQRAIKLTELGPRIELGLLKIEEGLGGNEGEVMFHELGKLLPRPLLRNSNPLNHDAVTKSPSEAAALGKKRKEREQRRKVQEAQVRAKAAAAEAADQARQRDSRYTEAEAPGLMAPVEEVEMQDDPHLADEPSGTEGIDNILDEVMDASEDESSSEEVVRAQNPRYSGQDTFARPKFRLKRL